MAISIFYDLETTTTYTAGQIVNYAFIAVDQDWEIVDECCGKIKLSNIELPAPGATLANRVDPIALQNDPEAKSEAEAVKLIFNFINSIVKKEKFAVNFAGYNSSKFDIVYLRTTLIRNGYNPYFEGKLVSRDLYLLARKLSLNPKFPRPIGERGDYVSLGLEALCTHYKLLDGPQLHESRADVILTIELAKIFLRDFGEDVRTFEPTSIPSELEKGECIWVINPKREIAGPSFSKVPHLLLDKAPKSALFVDLEKFETEKGSFESVVWVNKNSSLFITEKLSPDDRITALAKEAQAKFKNVTLSNFFEQSTCDIECDIYRLGFDGIGAMADAIHRNKRDVLEELTRKNPGVARDVKILLTRYRLRNHVFGHDPAQDSKVMELIKAYAKNRYGGNMQWRKTQSEPPSDKDYITSYVEDWKAYEAENAPFDEADAKLLNSLKEFVKQSLVGKDYFAAT